MSNDKRMPTKMKLEKPGKILIISSPSGGGKTSICRKLLSPVRKKLGWEFSVSYTTRPKRRGERNGREYHFVSREEFKHRVKEKFFAESFAVHLHQYGTPKYTIERKIKKGGVLLLDIDVKGALKIKKKYPDAITIFVLPPNARALRRRLRARGTETKEQLAVRFENAKTEMKLYKKFEYVVINDDLSAAVTKVLHIVNSHECRSEIFNKEQQSRIAG